MGWLRFLRRATTPWDRTVLTLVWVGAISGAESFDSTPERTCIACLIASMCLTVASSGTAALGSTGTR